MVVVLVVAAVVIVSVVILSNLINCMFVNGICGIDTCGGGIIGRMGSSLAPHHHHH